MNVWRLLPAVSAPMPFQMALDEILFLKFQEEPKNGQFVIPGLTRDPETRNPGFRIRQPTAVQSGMTESADNKTEDKPPILRFYFSSEPWVTVGYSQKGAGCRVLGAGMQNAKALNPDPRPLNPSPSVPVCKRMTGGGRVEHGKDLIFSLVAARTSNAAFKSVSESYRKIHEAVKRGFEFLGKPLEFYRCTETLPRGEDCFRFPITSDLRVENQKVAGGAQKRSRGFFLHQESVRPLSGQRSEDLIPAIQKGIEEVFQVRLTPADWEPEILEQAEALAAEKYGEAGAENKGSGARVQERNVSNTLRTDWPDPCTLNPGP